MATTTTRNLGLIVDSNLTANAKTNLSKIDTLGATFYQSPNGSTTIRGITDILFYPNSPDIGGSGSGGTVTFGSPSQKLDALNFYATSTNFPSLGMLDSAVGGTAYLTLKYNSTLSGSIDSSSRNLTIDVEGADRTILLGTNLALGSTSLTLGTTTYTLPGVTGTLADLASAQTFTNKSISGAANTITNVGYSSLVLSGSILNSDIASGAAIAYSKLSLSNSILGSDISSSAAIAYSKLNLSGSIVDSDVSSSAAIAGTKVSPNFGSSNVRTTGNIEIAKNGSIATILKASASQAANLTYTMPSSGPSAGQVLSSDAGGNLSWSTTGTGTVTSVTLALTPQLDNVLDVTNPTITTSGTVTLDLATQTANLIFAGPTSSTAKPTFRSLVIGDLPALTTDNISEGSNLYYTTARFDSRLATKSTSDISEGSNLYYTSARFNSAFGAKTTTDLTEGSNLYYTSARFDTAFSGKSTSNLTEGSNLYYTSARANSDFDARLATKSTSNLAEGSNLYYTDSRADARITTQKGSANGLATLDSGGKIPASQLPNSVMEYQGTWNASTNSPTLADGTGNAGDVYAVTVAGTQNLGSGSITFAVGDWVVYSGSIWQKVINSNAVVSVNGLTGAVTLTTTNISEGTNLYYTSSRFSTDFATKSTTNLSEGTNLYYTSARFDTAFSAKSTTNLSEGTNLYYTDTRVDNRLANYKVTAVWTSGDGTSKAITHNFGTNDVSWNVYDGATGEEVWPDTVVRTSTNILTFTSSQAPATNWKVLIRK